MRVSARQAFAYVAAPLLVGAAVAIRQALVGVAVEPETNALLLAVAIAAFLGGLGPGLLATGTGALQEAWLHMQPVGSLRVASPRDRLELAIFVLAGALVSVLVDRLVRARARAGLAASSAREAEERLRSSEERFRTLIESSPDLTVVIDEGGVVRYASSSSTTVLGISPSEAVGRSAFDFLHPQEAPEIRERLAGVVQDPSRPRRTDLRARRADGSWAILETEVTSMLEVPGVQGIVVTARDVTDRRASEESLRRARRTLRMVTRCNEAILRAGTEEELYEDVCKVIVEVGGYRMCWVGRPEHDARRTVRPVAHAGHEEGYLSILDIVWSDEPRGRGTTGTAIRERRMVVGQDFSADPSMAMWREEALRRGYRSVTSLPLLHSGEVLGVIVMYSGVAEAFGADELGDLQRLADDVAFGVSAIRQRAAQARQAVELLAMQGALRASETKFRTYVEAAPLAIFVADGRGRYVDGNPAALAMLGVDAPTLLSLSIADVTPEEDRPARLAEFGSLIATGRLDAEATLVRPDGGRVPVLLRGVTLGPDRYMAICQDVTARREAERGLRERQEYLDLILTTALDGFWVVDGEGRLVDVNPAYCAMSGYGRDELLGMRVSDLEAIESATETAARIRRIRETGSERFDTVHRRKDGRLIQISAAIRYLGAERDLIVGFFQDITERQQALASLRESERRYRTLVSGMSSGLVLQLADGAIADCNPGAEALLGLSADEMKGRTSVDPRWRALREDGTPLPGEEHPPMVALRTGQPQADVVMAVHKPSGEVTWLSVNSKPLRDEDGRIYAVLSTFVDVTRRRAAEVERNRLQAQLAKSARLAAMGTLVAGVAHEINNPLSGLTSSTGTALEDVRELQRALQAGPGPGKDHLLGRFDELLEMLVDASTSADRIARIVKDLTILGRPEQRRDRVRLADVVGSALRWLPGPVANRAEITTEIAEVPDVLASASQMEQVILNLATNAALSSPDGRRVRVGIRLGRAPGDRVFLEVSDDGAGIEPRLLERIFEPFFTTRPAGKGTGLGLSICNAIVGAHGGTLSVVSEPGNGATFRVELPAIPAG